MPACFARRNVLWSCRHIPAITASYASLQLFPLLFEKFVINEILEIRIPRDITRNDISKRVCLSISEISLCKCADTKGERNDSHSQFLCGFSDLNHRWGKGNITCQPKLLILWNWLNHTIFDTYFQTFIFFKISLN